MRLRLDLGYDGSGFSGWAKQPERRTVEGVLDEALAVVLRLDAAPGLTVAGRTDAGVHARGQVAHTDVPADAWAANGERAAVPALRAAARRRAGHGGCASRPEGFDARFSATSRRYAYRICDDPVGVDPIRRTDVVWNRRPLDVDAMNAAASELVGEHDFVAFCKRREGASTVRTLRVFEWRRHEDGLLEATVVGRRLLPQHGALTGGCLRRGGGGPASGVLGRARFCARPSALRRSW